MIFLSYSWADAWLAHSLHGRLAEMGHDAWIDRDKLDLGRPLEDQLWSAISIASGLLMIDSPWARASRWVQLEVSWALRARVPVLACSRQSLEQRMRSNSGLQQTWGSLALAPRS